MNLRALLLVFPAVVCVAAPAEPLRLTYDAPASGWMQGGLPIGNGHMGAMIYGDARTERIQFNEESLWTGDEDDTGAFQNFGEIAVSLGSEMPYDPTGRATAPQQSAEATADGNPDTKWAFEHHGKFPVVWERRMVRPTIVSEYTLTSAEDVPDRDPKAWKFMGSDDGVHWTLIDERHDIPVWEKRRSPKTFVFSNAKAFSRYRFEFSETHGAPHFQIAEIGLGKEGAKPVTDYRRELDLDRAVQRTSFTRDGVRFTREAFASFPAGVVVVRFTADKPGALSGSISMSDAHGAQPVAAGETLTIAGAFPGYKYGRDKSKEWLPLTREAQVRVLHEGGALVAKDGKLRVEKAGSLTLILAAGTDFKQDRAANWRGAPPHEAIAARIEAVAKRPYGDLLAEHVADYRRLFSRVELSLGETPAGVPANTGKRMRTYAPGPPDTGLESLLFQYGRYLLISSSRAGGLPANLQGKWNNSNNPPWRCDYHTDINVEMNYWPAGPANLDECFRPYTDWIVSTYPVREEETNQVFKVRGWATKGESGPFGGATWDWTPGTAAWLMQNLYDHWLFTRDVAFLRDKAYPAMKSACDFWIDRLEALPDGTLVTPKSFSPEQMRIREQGVSFEQETVMDLFTNTREVAVTLGVDKDFRDLLAQKTTKLLVPKIGKWGQLQEWMSDLDDPKDNHRHTSHLFAVHPGRQITPSKTPALANAAKVSLIARGEESNGWAYAWRGCIWARLHEPERAYDMLRRLIRPSHSTEMGYEKGGGLYDNLLCACPPFQIDGNFGYTAAVCEMLLQSHLGEIELLPALPAAWAKSGAFKGLRARGGFTVDCTWKDGRPVSVTVYGKSGDTAAVRFSAKVVREKIPADGALRLDASAFL